MNYLPIFCSLKEKPCLLVGGGAVAERKARLLLNAGAILTVNALHFTKQFQLWAANKEVKLVQSAYCPSLLTGHWLVIAATDEDQVNQSVYDDALSRHIFCNVVDRPQQSGFIMPSIIDRSPIMIAISSAGKAPVLARILRERLEAILPIHLGELANYAGALRQRVKAQFQKMSQRRRFWEKLLSHDQLVAALAAKDQALVEQITDNLFSTPIDNRGEVVLVGAGPGDAGLLTLKGLQQIQQADVIVYDRLVSEDILNLARRDAERIFVGKRAGYHCVAQEEINDILLKQAKTGKRVVRLKGGDPFIFGRGGEELESLSQANIPFSVVPGITAASGCSASSGVPLTHRNYAQNVQMVTGHLQKNNALDWSKLIAQKQTLVFYMGLSQCAQIQQQLVQHGMDSAMPVMIVENGTTPQQKVVTGRLDELARLSSQMQSPSLIIIGEVVALHKKLNPQRVAQTIQTSPKA